MKSIIETGAGQLTLSCNSATPLVCKHLFGLDVLKYFEESSKMPASEQIEILEKITYTMAIQAEMPLSEALNAKEGFLEWLSKYDFDDMTENIITKAMDLWVKNNQTSSVAKNTVGPQ